MAVSCHPPVGGERRWPAARQRDRAGEQRERPNSRPAQASAKRGDKSPSANGRHASALFKTILMQTGQTVEPRSWPVIGQIGATLRHPPNEPDVGKHVVASYLSGKPGKLKQCRLPACCWQATALILLRVRAECVEPAPTAPSPHPWSPTCPGPLAICGVRSQTVTYSKLVGVGGAPSVYLALCGLKGLVIFDHPYNAE